jgi:hypothetical protein
MKNLILLVLLLVFIGGPFLSTASGQVNRHLTSAINCFEGEPVDGGGDGSTVNE